MKVTKDDMTNIALYGGMSLVGGIGYGVAMTWVTQKTNVQSLRPRTEVLYKDNELLSLFIQLSKFRYLSENTFDTAVNEPRSNVISSQSI